jgi:hypothetical protein
LHLLPPSLSPTFSNHFSGLMNPQLPRKLLSIFRTLQRHGTSVTPLVRITKATDLHLLPPQRHGTSLTSTVGNTKANNHFHLLLPSFIPTPWNFSDIHGRKHQGLALHLLLPSLSPKFHKHFSGLMNPHLPRKLLSIFRTLQRHGTSVTTLVRITKATDLHLQLPSFIPTPWNISDNSGQERQGQSLPFATANFYSNAMELQ